MILNTEETNLKKRTLFSFLGRSFPYRSRIDDVDPRQIFYAMQIHFCYVDVVKTSSGGMDASNRGCVNDV
jgi:hypothetical protein